MKTLESLDRKKLKKIKLIVSDLDGVIVPRGTKIKQIGNKTILETKKINEKQIEQIKKLSKLGFKINISSGRGLYMLEEMFREVLDEVIITYENGSSSWINGKIMQHFNSYNDLKEIFFELKKIKDKRIKGFEPKEFIITIHATSRVKKIEKIVSKYKNLYTVWNGEAYDIGVKNKQTKITGLKELMKILKLKKENVLAIGDNFNDREFFKLAGITISADKSRLNADHYVPLNGKRLPADIVFDVVDNLIKRDKVLNS
ncbi:MAG: HAD-IIB family hydrolase [Candidatus Pacearchaeota archaeon]|jgi:HAD superfamily hydrolase (TIGR01484 family)